MKQRISRKSIHPSEKIITNTVDLYIEKHRTQLNKERREKIKEGFYQAVAIFFNK